MSDAFGLWKDIMQGGLEALSTGNPDALIDSLAKAHAEGAADGAADTEPAPAPEAVEASSRPARDPARCFGAQSTHHCTGHTKAGGCIIEPNEETAEGEAS